MASNMVSYMQPSSSPIQFAWRYAPPVHRQNFRSQTEEILRRDVGVQTPETICALECDKGKGFFILREPLSSYSAAQT